MLEDVIKMMAEPLVNNIICQIKKDNLKALTLILFWHTLMIKC